MEINYNRNTGLVVDADLALFIVDADISVRMRSCSDPHLQWDTKLLRPAFEVRREVAQTRIRHGVSQTLV